MKICIGYSELSCVLWWYSFTYNTHSSYPFHVPYHAQLQTHTNHILFHHYSMTILEILQEDTLQLYLVIFPDKTPNFGNLWTETVVKFRQNSSDLVCCIRIPKH
jgi:hypothetical protein